MLVDAVKRFENVAAVSEVLRGSVPPQFVSMSESVRVYGINIDDQVRVSIWQPDRAGQP